MDSPNTDFGVTDARFLFARLTVRTFRSSSTIVRNIGFVEYFVITGVSLQCVSVASTLSAFRDIRREGKTV